MRWKVLGLVFVILLVIGFLPLSLAAPCPGVTGCTDKAFSGRFCYHGEDITDIILKHYVIDGKFYLPENVTIYGCRYYHTATIEKGFCISVGLKGIYIGPGKCDPIIPGIGIHVGKGNCTQVGPLGIYLGQGECTPGGLGICTSTGPNGSYTGPGKCVSVGQKKLTQIGLGICICVGQDLIYIGPGECTHAGYNFLSIAPHGIYIGPGDSVYVGPNGIHVGTWGCTKFEPLHISISTATLPIYSCKETIEEMPEENIKYRKFSLAETGTINCIEEMTYNITITENQLVDIIKKYVYTDVSFQTKKEDLPLILEDINSTKLEEIRKEGNQSKYEEVVIYEMLNNTAKRLNKKEIIINATYSVPASSYGVLKVKEEKYYISFENAYTHMIDTGLVKVEVERKCISEGTSGYTVLNVLQHTVTITNKILKLFW